MFFQFFKWDLNNIGHISEQHVAPDEAEEVCYNNPLVCKTSLGRYCLLGRTDGGRYLTIIVDLMAKETVRVITARDMSQAERKRFYGR
ncbi:MAG: BrnT family toxin [Candidatus Omnitrophica bacterium]|nr:BrnT family toxin [Candidatus Omnitrophota bacterium]